MDWNTVAVIYVWLLIGVGVYIGTRYDREESIGELIACLVAWPTVATWYVMVAIIANLEDKE